MLSFQVQVTTRGGVQAALDFPDLSPASAEGNAIRVELGGGHPCPVRVTPPAGDSVRSIAYVLSEPLRNFHEVIVPDTGRGYSANTQLVDFWAKKWASRVNNIRMPLFLFTGQDLSATLAFGVIGANYETDFLCREPALPRALVAWMKRLTLEIRRGTDDWPIPDSVALANEDRSVTEHVWVRECEQLAGRTWHAALREFSEAMIAALDLPPRSTDATAEPWWCSWTDWFSDDVTHDVVLANVREGVELGIRNFIIDDGWFGPGLDNPRNVKLNIGDWAADPAKFPDLPATVRAIHAGGGRAIIWCAPHAVSPDCCALGESRRLLLCEAPGRPVLTHNGFHSLCFCSPEARQRMADICAGFIDRYDVDGAKYDLFNCVPDAPCRSTDHEHDTASMIQGLSRTLALIDENTRSRRPDFITELKQNYATPWLHGYGTCIRAGDTPYNPEGNFLRTAYINAYTPHSINDYQTITNNDSPDAAACIVVKMLTAGIPTYSMDLTTLRKEHKRTLRFLHSWHAENAAALQGRREALDGRLGSWRVRAESKDIYFVLNDESRLVLDSSRPADIIAGTCREHLLLEFDAPPKLRARVRTANGQDRLQEMDGQMVRLPVAPGAIVELRV